MYHAMEWQVLHVNDGLFSSADHKVFLRMIWSYFMELYHSSQGQRSVISMYLFTHQFSFPLTRNCLFSFILCIDMLPNRPLFSQARNKKG